jgi:hypothetical protein
MEGYNPNKIVSVVLSETKDLAPGGVRSFALLRMTKTNYLFIKNICVNPLNQRISASNCLIRISVNHKQSVLSVSIVSYSQACMSYQFTPTFMLASRGTLKG